MGLLFHKDQYRDESEPLITVNDRSFRFGDGVFETILVYKSQPYEFKTHLERLENGLQAFKIDYDTSEIRSICEELIKRNNIDTGYLRIIISRGINGPGSIGYKPGAMQPYLIIQAFESKFPEYRSIKLWTSSYTAHYAPPSKINSAMHYTLSMMEAEENACDNALILNHDGMICETSNANLWWFKADTLYTPSLDLPLVPGTVRRRLIELYDGELAQGHYHIDELADADEVFMSNIGGLVTSITEIMPQAYKYNQDSKTKALRDLLVSNIKSIIVA